MDKLMKKYFIKEGYIENLNPETYSDIGRRDEYQKEVYELADKLLSEFTWPHRSVIDIGCGSAFKLNGLKNATMKIGVELPEAIQWLRAYPELRNILFIDNETFRICRDVFSVSLCICADVIEHVQDPEYFLAGLRDLEATNFIISTPCRELVYGYDHGGPPRNKSHVREWTADEFEQFLSGRFGIGERIVTNEKQGTVAWICT